MKTIFDHDTRTEIINRIATLNAQSKPRWGKMNIYQMTKHCTQWDEWVLGTHHPEYKQSLLGRIFGKMALRNAVSNDKPMQKNMPAGDLKITDKTGDVEFQKQQWINRVLAYEHYSNDAFIHDFFGKMTKEQIGIFVYKHEDHHLRQFNA